MSDNDKKQTIKLNPTYAQALEFAMTTRRGSLLKAAPLPIPEENFTDDIPVLCDQIKYMNEIIAGMIDVIGSREQQLRILLEMMDLHNGTMNETREGMRAITTTMGEMFQELQEFQDEYDQIDSELKKT